MNKPKGKKNNKNQKLQTIPIYLMAKSNFKRENKEINSISVLEMLFLAADGSKNSSWFNWDAIAFR
mgnify:CR=1 FL=1